MTSHAESARGVVYHGAPIVTMDDRRSRAQAMWVRDGVVAAVGSLADVRRASGDDASSVNLAGRFVLPGLIDAHCHYMWYGYLLRGADCSPTAVGSVGDIQEAMAHQGPGADGWVSGSGYAEYELAENRHPTRADLDDAVPGHPAVVYQTSLHVGVVNSAGLAALGLGDGTPDPPRGRFGRDEYGRLDGRIYEEPLFDLMSDNMARFLDEGGDEARTGLVEGAGVRLASLGITACTDASTEPSTFRAMQRALDLGRLPIRIRSMFRVEHAGWLADAGLTTGAGHPLLQVGGVKIWSDGGMSSRTAAVEEPYVEPAGELGILVHDASELAAMIAAAEERDLQVAVHAQGDRAIRITLEAFESVMAPGNPLRHRIEHGGAFRPDLQEIAGALSICVVSQPAFLSHLGDGFLAAFGPERSEHLYPFRSLRDRGVVVAGSSDTPVVPPSPFVAIRDAVLRRTKRDQSVAMAETMLVADALEMYTLAGAFVSWADERIGSIESGKAADFIVVDRDPFEVAPKAVAETSVLGTFVDGRQIAGAMQILPRDRR